MENKCPKCHGRRVIVTPWDYTSATWQFCDDCGDPLAEVEALKAQRNIMRDTLISVQAELEQAWYRQEGPRAYSEHEAAILQTIAEALKIGATP